MARLSSCSRAMRSDRKSTRLNSSHTEIYTLSLHDALPICAHQPSGQEAAFGLVAEAKFIALDGASEFMFQGDAFDGLGGEVAGVAFHPVAALGLGAVHGGVGVLDQRGDVAAVGGEQAAADTSAHEELVLAGLEGRCEAAEQLVGDGFSVAGVLQAG